MHDDGEPGRAPSEFEDTDMAMKKKGFPSPQLDVDFHELSEKRKSQPPRFSTIFGSAPPPPPPPPREYVQEHYPEPRKKSGIHMSWPVFFLFVAILFFSWTIIFAYTVIGLYNNAPARLFPWAGQGAAFAAACDCNAVQAERQPAINIAPNFVVPQQKEAVTQLVTVSATPITVTATPITITATPSISSSTSTTTTSTSSTSSTSSANPSAQAAALASDIAGMLGGIGSKAVSTSSPIALVTVGPERATVTSVKMVTYDASGNVISATPAPTVTLTTLVDPPASSAASATITSSAGSDTLEPIIIVPTTAS